MKTYRFIAAFAAIVALAVGCTQEVSRDLDELKVDNSYINIPKDGGNVTMVLTATTDWEFYTEEKDYTIPSWLTVDKLSGAAGKHDIKFSAEAYAANRSASLKIRSKADLSKVQYIYVGQGVPEVSEATCAQIIAGPDGKTYKVTGTVSSIAESVKYGNWYITDETGTVYIYGTKYQGQTQQGALEKLGISVGDILTIEGPKSTYNGTVELVDVDITKIVKCLITAKAADNASSLSADGEEFNVDVIIKGDTFDYDQPDWITLSGLKVVGDTTRLTFAAAPNVDDVRSGEIVFTSVKGSQTSEAKVTVTQKSGLSCYSLPFEETFADGLGAFEINNINVAGSKNGYVWSADATNHYAKATAGVKNATEADLVSPLIDLTSATVARLSFDHVQRYAGNVYEELTVWVSTTNGESWEQVLVPEYSAGSNWTFVTTSLSLDKFVGNQVKIAFKYKSTADAYATWEIKNLKIEGEEVEVTNIAQLQGLATSATTEFTANLKDAVVTYINGIYAFLEDATGGILIYKEDHGLNPGDKFNGKVTGKIKIYGGFAELTDIDVSEAEKVDSQFKEPTVITIDKLLKGFNRYVSCQIKLEGVTLDADLGSNRNANVKQGESTISAYAKVKNTVTISKDVNGDLKCFPCYNGSIEKPQVGIWQTDHFTAK